MFYLMCGIQLYLSKISDPKTKKLFLSLFNNIKNRGPEDTELIDKTIKNTLIMMGFQRLKINDTSDKGNQPFIIENKNEFIAVITNGEIYNHHDLITQKKLITTSDSDCEVILRMYEQIHNQIKDSMSIENYVPFIKDMIFLLDGVFAGVILHLNKISNKIHTFAFRDRYGVRPMYYGTTETSFGISSELKGLCGLVENIKQFPPGNVLYYDNENENLIFTPYFNYHYPVKEFDIKNALLNIKIKFENAVTKRLMSDRPVCCLLSGGLDSSLVASVLAKKSDKPIHTFCIGMKGGEDFYYAKLVANHIKSIHHEIICTKEEFLQAIPEVTRIIETFDGTTNRASVGQYLVSKKIKETTDFKVVYVGEGSDELTGGYLYFHNAPDEIAFDKECKRLLKDIHFFDGKRSDRCVSHFGLETRVPFLDKDFTDYYLSIDPKLRFHKITGGDTKIEKYLLRKAFDIGVNGEEYLPSQVLWRIKEAFSDGVSNKKKAWYQIIQEHISKKLDEEQEDFKEMKKNYGWYLMPYNQELYYYRKIFELHYGSNKENALLIPYFWLPKWSGNITEASARVLKVYKN